MVLFVENSAQGCNPCEYLTCLRYVMLASVLGFYSLPIFRNLRPVPHGTPMVKVIGNCIVLLILSSALPIMSRTLGKT